LEFGGEAKIASPDGSPHDEFGSSVALFGDRVLIGVPMDSIAMEYAQGSAYVYVRGAEGWTLEQQLVASDGTWDDQFGTSVALSADRALVGALGDSYMDVGSVYAFAWDGAEWIQEQRIVPSDGGYYDQFGRSVALSGDRALIGAARYDIADPNANEGAAYVFVRNGSVWTEVQTLTASDGAADDHFGTSVALSNDRALIGAPGWGTGVSAYAYVWDGLTFGGEQRLAPADGAPDDQFGWTVALSGDQAIVGAHAHDVGLSSDQGAAYTYDWNGSAWVAGAKLVPSDGGENAWFGYSVALSADRALVGAPLVVLSELSGAPLQTTDQGGAYVYLRTAGTWTEQQRVIASDGDSRSWLGSAVALSGELAAVGAPGSTIGGNAAEGSVYVFTYGSAIGARCAMDEECASRHCSDARCCDSVCDGACDACSVAAGAESDGTCTLVPAGSLGAPACGPLACTGESRDCEPCDENADCPDGQACAADDTCRAADGEACSRARECASEHCVDGVCCDSACDEQCASCAEPGSIGNCIAVRGEPRGDRAPCAGDPDVCGGACDGAETAACHYAPSIRVCARVCEDGRETPSYCDGQGACIPRDSRSCGDYACGADRCLTLCDADSDCADGRRCDLDECVPAMARCSSDLRTSLQASGEALSCAPYLCDPTTGGCRSLCNGTLECASGNVCDPDDRACHAPPQEASNEEGGCGCRMGQRLPVATWAPGLVLLAFLVLRRRRGSVAKSVGCRAALLLFGLSGCSEPTPSERVTSRSEPLVYGPETKIIAANGARDDAFGAALAVFGDRALIGAPGRDIAAATGAGSAYSYVRTDTGWELEKMLVASDHEPSEYFGNAVALSADWALVGAPWDNAEVGSVYAYAWNGTSFREEQKLVPSDAGPTGYFGSAIALSGDRALVAAPQHDIAGPAGNEGAVYVFALTGSTWTEVQKLVASDAESNAFFGTSVALSGDRALIGAAGRGTNRGAAYAYTWDGDSFADERLLLASDGVAEDVFGASVALEGDRALIGSFGDTVGSSTAQGSAYAYAWNGSAWSNEQQLLAADGAANSWFGYGVALAGDLALVSAPLTDIGQNANKGAAYVFAASSNTWVEQQKLVASDGMIEDFLGARVALSAERALVSTTRDMIGENTEQGSVYVFEYGRENGDPCTVNDECASRHCSDARCCDSACDGACDACSEAAGADADGVCAPVAAGSPGVPACDTLACTGESPVCEPCSRNRDCPPDRRCAADDTCRKADGEECVDPSECASTLCVDGVCCESACRAQCAACAEPGALGSCVAVSGEPRGDRPPCAGDPGVCGGACDGAESSSCRYAPAASVCASSCEDGRETTDVCDGEGACVQGDLRSCGDYACGPDRCLETCEDDADCATGRRCELGECVLAPGSCSDDLSSSELANGSAAVCAPYLCDPSTGSCRLSCGTSADCSPGTACDSARRTCGPEPARVLEGDGGGCGCRIGINGRGGAPWLLFAAVALFALRRRRRPGGPLVGCRHALALLALTACSPSEPPGPAPGQWLHGLSYGEERRFVAADGTLGDQFGTSLAMLGDRALVGTPWDTIGGSVTGSAYSFVRDGNVWRQEQKLVASDRRGYDFFGATVALSANRALVSAQGTDSATTTEVGSVYVYVRDATSWREEQELMASDAVIYDGFGGAVAISGDRVVVGAHGCDIAATNENQGAVYVFVLRGSTWVEVQKLLASDPGLQDNFGASIAMLGDRLLVGALGHDDYHGAAYIYTWNGSSYTDERKLLASDRAADDWFGQAVALSGERALIGAGHGNASATPYQGSAYVYAWDGNGWNEEQKLIASDASEGAFFGASVALIDDRALVGAWTADGVEPDQGAAYVYARSGSIWTEEQKLVASAAVPGARLGMSVALSAERALVGAPWDQVGARLEQGAVYVFEYGEEDGSRCTSDTECSSRMCSDGRCCNSACDGACDACSVAAGATANGVCTVVAAGSVGSPACEPLACTGAGPDCAPCSRNADCAPHRGCTLDDTCKKSDGESCTEADECVSEFCVDGVCCNSACLAQCAACGEPGSLGTCTAVTGAPRGDRPPCAGDPDMCGGECDGAETSSCRYAPTTRICSRSCRERRETKSVCDGEGACVEGDLHSCGDYACGIDRCLTFCEADSDCASGRRCELGACVPAAARCSDDLATSLLANGDAVACAPYLCDPSRGSCRALCNTTTECAAGNVCDSEQNSCHPPAIEAEQSGGCGCRVGAGSIAAERASLLALLLLLVPLGRKRRAVAREREVPPSPRGSR
jgi:MYXO-CTERM domain-containing protein